MKQKGTLEVIGRHLALAMAPLQDAVKDLDSFKAFLYRLGWVADSLPQQYVDLATQVNQVINSVQALSDEPTIEEVIDLFNNVKNLFDAIKAINDAPAGVDPGLFFSEISESIFEYLLISRIQYYSENVYSWLVLLGVILREEVTSTSTRPSFFRQSFNFNSLVELIKNPASLPERIYGWGTNDLDFERIIFNISGIFFSCGIPTNVLNLDPNIKSAYGIAGVVGGEGDLFLEVPVASTYVGGTLIEVNLEILEYRPSDGSLPGIILQPVIPDSLGHQFDFTDSLSLSIRAGTDLTNRIGLIITPQKIEAQYPFQPGNTFPEVGFGATIDYHPSQNTLIFGTPDKTRLEFSGAAFQLNLDIKESIFEVEFLARIRYLTLILDGGEGDGFLNKILGDKAYSINIPLEISWSNITGFKFKGGSLGLEVILSQHIKLGPLTIDQLKIALKALLGSPPGLDVSASANLSLLLGPFAAVAEELGVRLRIKFEDGNAGPFDISVGFKPPNGLGLSFDTTAVKGGGYLYFNHDEKRYAGVAELSIKDKIALKAIGLLTTRMPDGSKGFSLLLIITAEFPAIQLGFGFSLAGVGGLIGTHRTMKLEVLRSGLKTGANDRLLFPSNPVENAPQIISELGSIFPVEEGRFTFGIMALIFWGTPPLITIKLGIIIEVPNPVRLAILGVIKAALPDENNKLLILQVAFLGTIEFEKGQLGFDATLYDSKLLEITLAGDMALRLAWKEPKNFVLSVGGFHPAFTAPAGLAGMQRMTINFLGGDNPRLTLTTYFAVTTNSVQFGAKAEMYIRVTNNLTAEGYFGFDALFKFNPFYMLLQVYAYMGLKWKGKEKLSISLNMSLEGPTPWNAQGEAEVKILGIKYKVQVSKTWGESKDTSLPQIEVKPKLRAALNEPASWTGNLPAGRQLVTIRALGSQVGLVHPVGEIQASQKTVPLNLAIQKFGSQFVSDGGTFSITNVTIGSHAPLPVTQFAKDDFVPAHFRDIDDNQKLSGGSFVRFDSGARIDATAQLGASYFVKRAIRYEYSIAGQEVPAGDPLPTRDEKEAVLNAMVKGSAAGRSPLSFSPKKKTPFAPKEITIKQEKHAVVNRSNLTLYDNASLRNSYEEAVDYYTNLVKNSPSLKRAIHIVPEFEIEPA